MNKHCSAQPPDGEVQHWDKIVFQITGDKSKTIPKDMLKKTLDLKILDTPEEIVDLEQEVKNAVGEKFGVDPSDVKIKIKDVLYQTVTCAAAGPAGEIGPEGPAGADGTPSPVNTYVRIAQSGAVSPGGITTQTVSCDSGDIVTGGGHEPTNFDSLSSSNPILTDPLTTWKGSMKYIGTSGTAFLTVFVVCADTTP